MNHATHSRPTATGIEARGCGSPCIADMTGFGLTTSAQAVVAATQ
jgi:hypothetical protein